MRNDHEWSLRLYGTQARLLKPTTQLAPPCKALTSCTATCLFRPQSWPGADLVQASRTKKRKVPSNPEVLGPSRSWRPAQAAPAVLSLRRSQAPNILSLAKDIDHGEDAFEPDEHDEAQPGTQEE